MVSPPSNHPVTKRNVAVVDSSINAVLIVDGQAEGGHRWSRPPNNWSDKDDINKWLNPLSVATRDSCKHIFVTSKTCCTSLTSTVSGRYGRQLRLLIAVASIVGCCALTALAVGVACEALE